MKKIKSFIALIAMVPVFLFTSCDQTNTGPNSITIDGQTETWSQGALGWSALIGTDYMVTYKSSFIKGSAYPSITLAYGRHVYSTYSQADFFAFFTTGDKAFAVEPSEEGFAIYYNEGSSGPTWSSAAGSQSGSTVTFNSITEQPASGFAPARVKYNITVNAKMYNVDTPTSYKNVSGTFEGSFERY